MTNLNPAAESARETARHGDGKFGEQQRPEAPEGVLTPGAPAGARATALGYQSWLSMKEQEAQLSRASDRFGAYLVAQTILEKVPHAAYLQMEESDQSTEYGFWANKILDENKQPIGDIDEASITDTDGNEVEINGDVLYEVLSGLPQQTPLAKVGTREDGAAEYGAAPEYAWFTPGTTAYIDLREAAKDE